MKEILKKYKLTLIALGILALMVGTFWFAIRPMFEKIDTLRIAIQQEITRKQHQEKQIKKLPELKNQYEAVLGEERYFDILLTEDRVVGFIRTLEALARDTKTEIKIESNEMPLVSTPPKKAKATQTDEGDEEKVPEKKEEKLLADILPFNEHLRLTLRVKGDYASVVAFLMKLETLPVALDVLAVSMQQPLPDEATRSGDVQSASPFAPVPSTTEGDDSATPTEEGATEEKSELIKPVSPQLEGVFDIVVYVDKK